MTQDELYTYLRNPDLLTQEMLPDLRELLEAYPYCSSYIALYLQALSHTKDLRYSSELKRLALYLPDRRWLYSVLEHTDTETSVGAPAKTADEEGTDAFDLIDSFLSDAMRQGEDLPSELLYPTVGSDRDDYFATSSLTESESTEVLMPDAASTFDSLTRTEQEDNTDGVSDQADEGLNEDLFTETLAKIYIQQGKYDKALRIIRSISLNYPKKNLYFADQIRFLELLVDNKQ